MVSFPQVPPPDYPYGLFCYVSCHSKIGYNVNLLFAELKPICHLLALLGTHQIFHVSGLSVKADGTVWYCEYRPDRF
jgi:hypothetical protein